MPHLAFAIDTQEALPNIDQIHQILQHLGYPQSTWPAIDKGLTELLTKLDFAHLKQEASQVKSDPVKLKAFISKLGGLLEKEGCIDRNTPYPLVKLLTTSLASDDLSQVIFSSPISFFQKVDSKKALVACTAISQLGSIILELLDINVKVGFSPAHVFNCIPIDDGHVLLADFSNQYFAIVDMDQYYYNLASSTRKLKDQYRVSPARLTELNGQLMSELPSDTLPEVLASLYLNVYISPDYAVTPAIYINFGNIYSHKENYDQAFLYFNKAITLNADYAEAYRERGITYGNKGQLDMAISDFSKAIELFGDFADAYHDRGNIYSERGEIDNAISDFNQAIIIDPDYAEAYRDRGLAYNKKGDLDSAISDYSKAIDIDPYYSEAYQSRAQVYYDKNEYDNSRKDIQKVEDFGDEVNADLVDKLKNNSPMKRYFPFLLAIPIFILFIIRLF